MKPLFLAVAMALVCATSHAFSSAGAASRAATYARDTAIVQGVMSDESTVEVLAFTSEDCRACQKDKPKLEELKERGVKVTEIDADEHPELDIEYGVESLPTYVVEKDGVEIKRARGVLVILSFLAMLLAWIF